MSPKAHNPVVVWFRQDLRLGDNPALAAAARTGRPILPVYVQDDESAGQWAMGAASRWWLHHSLHALDSDLGGSLSVFRGNARELIPELVRTVGAPALYFNRCIEPWRTERDAGIVAELTTDGIRVEATDAVTLFDPDAVLKADGTPYRVFTPFFRKGCLEHAAPPREPLAAPKALDTVSADRSAGIDALELMPRIEWYRGMAAEWTIGEAAAAHRLDAFIDSGLDGYAEGRNRPDLRHVSRLSPHLHFGEISPHQIWHAVQSAGQRPALERDAEVFLSELGWREFSCYLLRHFPELPTKNLQRRFDRFPWRSGGDSLDRWQRGLTGYPIVDAGMRELWTTGYMHNRVRMIVGSFLVKNLLLHWHHGETWFWDTLVDADLANNSAGWQWVAGSGADASPYFRIFNPVTQGRKFDPQGDYVRRFVPELRELDADELHEPWQARRRGAASEYPEPIVDLKASREQALEAFRFSASV
jgi:deoxyribodipyrimidine photo-lyase